MMFGLKSSTGYKRNTEVAVPNFIPDLQNATLSKPKHARGHVASFSEAGDGYSNGFELMIGLYNLGGDSNFGATVANATNAYATGIIDIQAYTNSITYEATINDLATARNGNKPIASAAASGDMTYKAAMKSLVLYFRNALRESNGTKQEGYNDGITDDDWIDRASTIWFEDYCMKVNGQNFAGGTNIQGYEKLDTIVSEVISGELWYTNHMHQSQYVGDYPKDYFAGINSRLGSSDVYRAGIGDVLQYYWIRTSISSITGLGSLITVNYSKIYPSSPYENITSPAWVKVDLSGTQYAGRQITTSHGGKIRSMGNDVYYISVNLDYTTTSVSFSILESISPLYINLDQPVLNIVGNSVTCDQPVKIALFRKLKTEPYIINVSIVERQNTLSTSFTIAATLNTTTYDYYLIGVNAEGIKGNIQF